jgi:hypothetical protein
MKKVTPSDKEISNDLEEYQRFRALVERTNTESPAAADLVELRRVLDTKPHLWRWAGNVARRAAETIMHTYSYHSALELESTKRVVEAMRAELGYEEASVLERVLIDQVLTSWLHVNLLEMLHCEKLTAQHNAEAGIYWDRRLTMAHRRFTRACDSLARVRKLVRSTPAAQPSANATASVHHLKALTGTGD